MHAVLCSDVHSLRTSKVDSAWRRRGKLLSRAERRVSLGFALLLLVDLQVDRIEVDDRVLLLRKISFIPSLK